MTRSAYGSRRIALACAPLLLLSLRCQQPVAPGQPIGISNEGKNDVRVVLSALRTLKTISDIRDVSGRFSFTQAVFDTPRIRLDLQTADSIGRLYTTSLARVRRQLSPVLALTQSSLARSVAEQGIADTLVRACDSILSVVPRDSVDSAFYVVCRLAPRLLDSVWTSGHDTLAIHFADSDTAHADTVVERVARVRMARGGNVIDRQWWETSTAGLRLKTREQVQLENGVARYSRRSVIDRSGGPSVYDMIVDGGRRVHVERQIAGSLWWRTLDNSIVKTYVDTADSGGVAIARSMRDADQDTDHVILDFTSPDTQALALVTVLRPAGSQLDSTVVTETAVPSPALREYFRRIVRAGDTLDTRVSSIVYAGAGGTCVVGVRQVSPASRDVTLFGTRTASEYTYTCSFSAGFTSLSFTRLQRTDALSGGGVSQVLWRYSPKGSPGITSLPVVEQFDTIRVDAVHRSTDSLTSHELWERIDARDTVRYRHAWVGLKSDTVRFEMVQGGSNWSYAFDRPKSLLRSGTISISGGAQTVLDTLVVVAPRFVEGAIDSAGNGTLQIFDETPSTVELGADTVSVTFTGTVPGWLADQVKWSRTGSSYKSRFTVAGQNRTYDFGMALDRTGFVTGRCGVLADALKVAGADSIQVNPYYRGKALFRGIFEGDAASDIHDTLSIQLWGESVLAGEISF